MLVRSPTLTKRLSSVMVSGSRPDSRIAGAMVGDGSRGAMPSTAAGDRGDVVGRGAAAAADEVDEAARRRTPPRTAAVWSGVSSYSPKALGRPALG